MSGPKVVIVIPVYEGERTARLVEGIPAEYRGQVMVASPGPIEGASVLPPAHSWSAGCRSALERLKALTDCVVVTLDSSCNPAHVSRVLAPLQQGSSQLILGSRRLRKNPAMPGRAGTWVTCRLIQVMTGKVYTDITPYRAMTREAFEMLADKSLVGSQWAAPRLKLKPTEVPVDYVS